MIGGGWPVTSYQPEKSSLVLGYIVEWLASFHNYTFVLVSGYIFYALKFEQGRYKKYGAFLWNKCKRLLIPYFFFAVVWAAPMTHFFLGYNLQEVFHNVILGVKPGQIWFLLMLFWVFVFFWPISKLCNEKPIVGVFIVAFIYAIGVFGDDFITGYFRIFWAADMYCIFGLDLIFENMEAIC